MALPFFCNRFFFFFFRCLFSRKTLQKKSYFSFFSFGKPFASHCARCTNNGWLLKCTILFFFIRYLHFQSIPFPPIYIYWPHHIGPLYEKHGTRIDPTRLVTHTFFFLFFSCDVLWFSLRVTLNVQYTTARSPLFSCFGSTFASHPRRARRPDSALVCNCAPVAALQSYLQTTIQWKQLFFSLLNNRRVVLGFIIQQRFVTFSYTVDQSLIRILHVFIFLFLFSRSVKHQQLTLECTSPLLRLLHQFGKWAV